MLEKVSKSCPRFRDERGLFDVARVCKCGYAVSKDVITNTWDKCPLCSGGLVSRRVDYPHATVKGG